MFQKQNRSKIRFFYLQKIETCIYVSADGIEIKNTKTADTYKRFMHNFIDANKIDSGDLYLGEKQCTMLNKCQFFHALFEHCTDEIYKPVTEQRLKVYNSTIKPTHHIGSKSNESKKAMAEFVELAQTLGEKDGHKSHEVTIKFMESWSHGINLGAMFMLETK